MKYMVLLSEDDKVCSQITSWLGELAGGVAVERFTHLPTLTEKLFPAALPVEEVAAPSPSTKVVAKIRNPADDEPLPIVTAVLIDLDSLDPKNTFAELKKLRADFLQHKRITSLGALKVVLFSQETDAIKLEKYCDDGIDEFFFLRPMW